MTAARELPEIVQKCDKGCQETVPAGLMKKCRKRLHLCEPQQDSGKELMNQSFRKKSDSS